MKKVFLAFISTIACLSFFSSCHKPGPEPKVEITVGAYFLNNGNDKSNDASLSFYDPEAKSIVNNVFSTVNGKKLGDLAQDMIIFGSKMYISVYNSKIIFVTDLKGKIIKEITSAGEKGNLSPRYFTSYGDKIYATYYEGYVAQIDTASYAVKTIKVGPNPEQVIGANGKLYVANSGGFAYPVYNNTVSVVNASTFTVSKTLEVVMNPQSFEMDADGNIYLVSIGNYGTVPFTLQKIDPKTDEVTAIAGIAPSFISIVPGTSTMYMIESSYDAEWNLTANYYVYDIKTAVRKEFITDGTEVKDNPYSITTDSNGGFVYIGTSDYKSNGDMYVFTSGGVLNDKVDTGGLNPITVAFLTEMK